MFDIAEIHVRAGDGGKGAVSFRREKGIPRGGPNGGNGGKGGDVVLIGRGSLRTLKTLHFQKMYSAESGVGGRGKDMYGIGGKDLTMEVPCGTVVSEAQPNGDQKTLGELVEEGQLLRVARGGRGGRGNASYATATQQAPYIAEKGEAGEERRLRLELRLIADVGIIGKPNAGKSTLLTAASAARPKIAPYPFTTLEPQLGVVDIGYETFVMAEIPGLIEGAHLGIGLGHEFLRHATRTKVLIHLVDGSVEDVSGAIREINNELEAYGTALRAKPQIIAVNKMDIPDASDRRGAITKELAWTGTPLFFLSAAGDVGVRELMRQAGEMLAAAPELESDLDGLEPAMVEVMPGRRKRERGGPIVVKDGTYVVLDERAVRLVAGSSLGVWAGLAQVKGHLDRMKVTQALEDAGIQHGDTVRFGDIELIW